MGSGHDQELDEEGGAQRVRELTALFETESPALGELVALLDGLLLKLDDDGTIEFTTAAIESVLGYDPDSLVGEPVELLVEAENFMRLLRAGPADNVPVSLVTLGGQTTPAKVSWRPLDSGGYLCLAQDVDERRQVERELDQYRELVDAVGDPMYVLDEDGAIERVNDAMVEYTGYERTELVGRSVGEIIPAKEYDRATAELADVATAGEDASTTFETTLVTKDGELVLTEANVTSLTDADGNYAGSVGALRDIRDRKQRERDLDMLKEVLTRVFRHNVRNELTVVQGHADLLLTQVDEESRQFVEKIVERSGQLLDHTEKARLLTGVIEKDERYETDLALVVDDIAETARSEHSATVETAVPAETVAEAHPAIEDAIEELVDNAIRHASDDEPWVRVWTDETDEFLTLFVEDESGGLDEHEIEVLREGTESDLEHGSGVGLWLVRSAVEHSEADMIAHRTDNGSLMGIRFPRHDRTRDAEDVVEDSPFARVPAHVQEEISPERFHGEIVIGRMEELHELEDTYDALARTGGHSVLVTGETGVGKSTLVEQFRERVSNHEDAPLLATGACEPERTQPYHVFRRAMADLPVGTQLQELLADAAVFEADDPESVRHRKQALFAGIADQLRELALDHTVVFLVEDLQWADPGTIDLLEFLIEEVGRWAPPILFVGTYRVEDVGRAHPVLDIAEQMTDAGRGTVLELEPFGPGDVETLLGYILDLETVPESFVESVSDHTGGTPLFVAELGRHLAETLGPSPAVSELPADLSVVSVPETVESAVTERLEGLAGPVESVLQTGAIIGETVSFDVLRKASELSEADLVDCVDNLVSRRLWNRSGETMRFVHGLLRETVLDGIEETRRVELHARVAHAIETVYQDQVEEHSGRLARHYDEAGRHETALAYYQHAGDRAAEAYTHQTAIEHYERATEIAAESGDDETWETACQRLAELHLTAGEYDQATEYVDTVREHVDAGDTRRRQRLARLAALIATRRGEYDTAEREVQAGLELDDTPSVERCRLLDVAAQFQQEQGRYENAKASAQDQLDLATDLAVPELRSAAMRYLGIIAWREGEFDQAREYTHECLSIGEAEDDKQIQARSLHFLGVTAWGTGEYDQAREYYERSRSLKQDIGDRHGAAKTLNNLGLVAQEQGNYEQAREYYEACLDTYRNLGDRHGEAKTLNNLGIVVGIQGNYEQAREYYERCLDIERDIGDRQGEAKVLTNLGQTARKQGDYEWARERLDESLEINSDLGDRRNPVETRMHLGFVALSQGDHDRARKQFETSLETARELDIPNQVRNNLRGLARLEREQGNPEQAVEHLAAALEDDESGDPLTIAQVHLEAGWVALARNDVESAREHAARAYETVSDLGAAHWVGRTRLLNGEIDATASSGDPIEHWEGALGTFEGIGAPQDALRALSSLVAYHREHGDDERARERCRQAQECLAGAPDPVVATHESWVTQRAAELGLS